MSKYASILFTPNEYHSIGPFRFPIYKDLTPGESKGIEEITRKQSKTTFKSIKLAQQIAKDKEITTKEAIDLMGSIGDDDKENLALDYAEQLEQLQGDNVGAVEQQCEFVTLVMRYRGEAKLKKSWDKLSDWSMDDTEAMPTKLLEEVFQFILWERDGWPEVGKPEEDQALLPPQTIS